MFDTHCHLNFKVFSNNLDQVIKESADYGVRYFMIPGTDEQTSRQAVQISLKYKNAYCSVGLHPHHIYDLVQKNISIAEADVIGFITELSEFDSVKAIGEIGFDKHLYKKTKYQDYKVTEKFLVYQKVLFERQLRLSLQLSKSLIIHCREAEEDLLEALASLWDKKLEKQIVFHCCPASKDLLDFAIEHRVFIGVDGDVTYDPRKQAFIKKVPLDLLILETDSPFITPEPVRSQVRFPNTPANLIHIAKICAYLKDIKLEKLIEITTENGLTLFNIN